MNASTWDMTGLEILALHPALWFVVVPCGITVLWLLVGIILLTSMDIHGPEYMLTRGRQRCRCNCLLGPVFWVVTGIQFSYIWLREWINEE